MKDYAISIVALGSASSSAYAAQTAGTLSDRPIIVKKERGLPLSAAPFIATIHALEDLRSFLHEGDAVDVSIHAQGADVQTWISRGSGDTQLDAKFKSLIINLGKEGISVSLQPLMHADKALKSKAEMALLLN